MEVKLCISQCSGPGEAVVAIPETNPVFEAPVRYAIDSLTEKVKLNLTGNPFY